MTNQVFMDAIIAEMDRYMPVDLMENALAFTTSPTGTTTATKLSKTPAIAGEGTFTGGDVEMITG
jgi:hypothetical protein